MAFVAPTVPAVGDLITAAQAAIIATDLNGLGTMGTPAQTSANGTVTAGGAVEIRDAVLGSYVFTAVAGRRYQVVMAGQGAATSVAGDAATLNVRNGGAATPTTASPVVASGKIVLPASSSGSSVAMSGSTFVPGAGVQTLSLFTVRTAGTGVITPVVAGATPARELYVVDLGPA